MEAGLTNIGFKPSLIDHCLFYKSPSNKAIDKVIQELKDAHFEIDDMDMQFQENTKERDTPTLFTKILNRDQHGTPMEQTFHYRRVIGKLPMCQILRRPQENPCHSTQEQGMILTIHTTTSVSMMIEEKSKSWLLPLKNSLQIC